MSASMPPTPPMSPQMNYAMQPKGGNGYAVASLISSLCGFCLFFVGGIAGVIFGVLGLRRARETGAGKGMATAGLVLGIVSLISSGIFALMIGAGLFATKGIMKLSEAPRTVARQYMTDLSQGNVDAALAQTSGMTHDEVASESAAVQALGGFHDMTSSSFNIVNNSCVLIGVAQFAKGTENYTITLNGSGADWKVSSVELR